ncbi:penicillin-binding transpeptidase domain-containing protein, partial [candidate division KSB1 bacterium]
EGVVERGTATAAKSEKYPIAGKTGTAQKLDPVTGKYSDTDYISSFVAFYPAENPKIAGIVIIDSPKGANYYGGAVAGPVMKEIINRIAYNPKNTLLALTMPVEDPDEKENKGIWQRFLSFWKKDENNRSILTANAKNKAEDQNENTSLLIEYGRNSDITAEDPDRNKIPEKTVVVPDVVGKPIGDAVKILSQSGLDPEIKGTGIVSEQDPKPGTKLIPGKTVNLTGKRIEDYIKNNNR